MAGIIEQGIVPFRQIFSLAQYWYVGGGQWVCRRGSSTVRRHRRLRLLKRSALLALMSSTTPVLAQNISFLNLEPNFTLHVFEEGTVITPASTVPQPGAAGTAAHTNVHLFLPTGMAAIAAAGPAGGPPVPGLFLRDAGICCLRL